APGASVQLIDIDPDSPELGRRIPIEVSFREAEGVYVESNTLRFLPSPGFPLRPATRYALVVTNAVRAAGGGAVRASSELAQTLGLEAATIAPAWQAAVAPDLSTLTNLGVNPSSLVHLAIFTTADPTAEVRAVAEHARSGAVAAPDFDPDAWEV